jgi:hypothetical protein
MSAYGKSKIITGVANSPATVLRQIEDVSKETITELFHWIFEEGQTGVVILGDTPVSSEVVDFLKF